MIKKVNVSDLKRGMYVSALDRPWRDTPFLFQRFEITDDEQLAQLKQRCKYVYIDDDYQTGTVPQVLTPPLARTLRVEPAETDQKPVFRIVAEDTTAPRPRRAYRDETTIEQEAEAIRETHEQATMLIDTIMEDVHLGKSLDTAGAKKAVGHMARSVLRNPDALLCFTQLKKKDDYTARHSLRVSILALAFGRHLGFDEEDLNLLGMGALLHDVGKMRVPGTILNKPGKLTDREYEIMKSHVPMGVEILERTNAIPLKALEVSRLHHERYGGKGYMENLKGDQITEFGLISAIVDVYDAITSDRVYKDGIASLDALKKMYEWRGRDFHPALLEQFIQCIGIFPIGSVVVLNTNEVGVIRTLNREQRLKPQVVLVMKPDKTRYPTLRAVNLALETAPTGKPYEITEVVPPAMFNIQPADYLPVRAVA